MGAEDASDLVVVSAFRDSYVPTRSSVIGQLARRGISVEKLATDKEADLRATTSCWISKPIRQGRDLHGFERLLCYEPQKPALAAEAVGDLFRALVPYVGGPTGVTTVAMPVVATGDQGQRVGEMMTAILDAAQKWMEVGLPLERLRIVTPTLGVEGQAQTAFASWLDRRAVAPSPVGPPSPESDATSDAFDVFVSYATADGTATSEQVVTQITKLRPSARVFQDKLSIDIGTAWQRRIATAIESSRRVVIVLTPGFLLSRACQEELNMAHLKHLEADQPVLFPLYVLSCALPLHIRVLNYIDCREQDVAATNVACQRLVESL